MADILPFKAFRYTSKAGNFSTLMSPLRESTAIEDNTRENKNSISFLTNSPVDSMAGIVNEWFNSGIIKKDELPAIYVYYQYFSDGSFPGLRCRKGFIPLLKIQDWKENIILKHEDIITEIETFQETFISCAQFFVNPIHGIFNDPDCQLSGYMEESMLNPVFEHEDQKGVLHKLSIIQDKKCIDTFIKVLKEKKIAIADGHHRYSAALNLSKSMPAGKDMYIPALLTNSQNNDIGLLPYHRLLTLRFPFQHFLDCLNPYVFFREIKNKENLEDEIHQNLHTFGILTKKSSYIIELKSEQGNLEHPSFTDLRMIDELLIARIPDFEKIKNNITYVHSTEECIKALNQGSADIAILFRKLTVEEVMNLSEKGIVLPEKSTYFYPKVLSGIVMSSTSSSNEIVESQCFKKI